MFQPYLAEYRYYALFEDGRGTSDIDLAEGLYRSVTGYDEQRYEGHRRWSRSSGLSRTSDRDSYDSYREVTPAEVEHLLRRTDAQRPEQPPESRDGFEGGGYAVFRQQADVVDMRSAYAVVDELAPEHRFAVQLAPFERDGLAGIIALLAARRRAEPVDGHYYFAEFDRLGDVVDVDRAHALLRCPASGEGDFETYLQDGEWVLGKAPRKKHVLPVGREDAERISRGRDTAEARYFDVWLGLTAEDGFYRHVVMRRTGSGDEATDDLGWQPTDLLGRLEPTWWVEELSARGFSTARYVATLMGRSRRFRGQAHDYQAVFRGQDDVYDFANVLFLVRKLPNPYELEYERWTPDGWKYSSGSFSGETLPISEEEFHRLAEPRPDERGSGDLRR
ncbi:hypothetical protein GCM10011609_49360 [Lentzea pudingi]|uniref:Uncharacterized protein n=1 Tax=Lentzea pudingi TaxID=1789439 RepID=A0ABQ2I964_9PSEU|nr:hypothetical protein [Lentzea pudingi]GGN04260.1 hypothetical protein GCM10011609_49360 [Lentzea pudingi]